MRCERCGLNPAEFEVVGGGRRQHVCEGCLPAAQREAGTPRSTVRIKVEAASADDGQLDLFDLGGGAA
jgi:protein-arginine kinase activator protein McsA